MRSRWFGLVVAFLAVALSIWAHPQLPPTVATHWNLNGTPDGYSSRAWALSIIPIVLVAMTVVFNVLPKIDPRHENYAKFLSSYWLIANAIIVFLLVAHGMIIAAGRWAALHLPGQLSHARRAELVHRNSHAVDAVERHRMAEDPSHRRLGVRAWRLRPGERGVPAARRIPAAIRRHDLVHAPHSDCAVLRVVEARTA